MIEPIDIWDSSRETTEYGYFEMGFEKAQEIIETEIVRRMEAKISGNLKYRIGYGDALGELKKWIEE